MPFEFRRSETLLLDGAIGSYIGRLGLGESDYAGSLRLAAPQLGNNDLLALTRPDVLTQVHEAYLEAGADVVTSCTFCAVRPMQAQHGAEGLVYEMALAGARLAKAAAVKYSTPQRPRFAAGSVGPTDKPLSFILADDEDAEPDELITALRKDYVVQISALIEGGADLLLIETCFDAMNAEAAVGAAREVFMSRGVSVPIVVSASIGANGRVLTGETPAQFFAKLPPVDAYSLNCAAPDELFPAVRSLARETDKPLCFYPNAGFPDADGNYSLTPADFAEGEAALIRELRPAMAGGCCGTAPTHISALARILGR